MPLPTAFDGFVELGKRVSPTCLITFDRNRHSVLASFANRPVSLRIYPERLAIVAEGAVICVHERIIERSHRQLGRVIYDWRHYLAVVQRKPGALRNGAPFLEMSEAFRRLQSLMLHKPGGDREMVELLSLVLQHDEQAVLCAVEMALEAGVPTKTHMLNLLHRLVDGKPTDQPNVTPPSALSLSKEPEANVARYDGCGKEVRVMRHDSAGAAIVIMLRSLKLPGMALAVNDLLEQGGPAFYAAVPMLSQLLKAEMADARCALSLTT